MTHRVSAFFAIGAAGFVLQIAAAALALSPGTGRIVLATLVAVESAILHNFFWHERWTWADRRSARALTRKRLLRFHLGTGMTSLIGNVLVTALAVEFLHLPTLVANTVAVAATSLVNFLVSDRWVFGRSAAAACCVALLLAPADVSAAARTRRETVTAWNRHIAAVELACRRPREPDPPATKPEGRSISVRAGRFMSGAGLSLFAGLQFHVWSAHSKCRDCLRHPMTSWRRACFDATGIRCTSTFGSRAAPS